MKFYGRFQFNDSVCSEHAGISVVRKSIRVSRVCYPLIFGCTPSTLFEVRGGVFSIVGNEKCAVEAIWGHFNGDLEISHR